MLGAGLPDGYPYPLVDGRQLYISEVCSFQHCMLSKESKLQFNSQPSVSATDSGSLRYRTFPSCIYILRKQRKNLWYPWQQGENKQEYAIAKKEIRCGLHPKFLRQIQSICFTPCTSVQLQSIYEICDLISKNGSPDPDPELFKLETDQIQQRFGALFGYPVYAKPQWERYRSAGGIHLCPSSTLRIGRYAVTADFLKIEHQIAP